MARSNWSAVGPAPENLVSGTNGTAPLSGNETVLPPSKKRNRTAPLQEAASYCPPLSRNRTAPLPKNDDAASRNVRQCTVPPPPRWLTTIRWTVVSDTGVLGGLC